MLELNGKKLNEIKRPTDDHTAQTEVIIILGKRGQGKTYLTKNLLEKDYVGSNIIIFDTLGEYDLINYLYAFDTEDFIEKVNIVHKKGKKLKLVYRPNPEEGEIVKQFEVIASYVWEISNLYFIIEEADRFCSAHYISEKLRQLIEYGRHKTISLILTTRRFSSISRSITAQATEIITFRQTEPRDLKLLSEFGFSESEVKNLEDHYYARKKV